MGAAEGRESCHREREGVRSTQWIAQGKHLPKAIDWKNEKG